MSDLITRLFDYVDRPWKIAAVVILVVVGIAGWIVYEKRDELIEAWLTPVVATLKVDEIPAALEKLAGEADLVQIWSVDLPSNTQKFMGARRRDGERPVIPSPRSLPIITQVSDARSLVTVLDGTPVCVDITARGTPVARRLADRGIKRGCAIPIPPGPETFVGVIYLAWAIPPESSAEDVAVRVAREIAGTLATR